MTANRIHISEEDLEKLKNAPMDKNTAILMESFGPDGDGEKKFTTWNLYKYLEEGTSKKGSFLTAREIADYFNVILPHAIAVLEFGQDKCVIVRLDNGNYKARKKQKIPDEVFSEYLNTNVKEIISNPKYKNKYNNYLKHKRNRDEHIRKMVKLASVELEEDVYRDSYDKISRTQIGLIQETGHGRKKTAEWNAEASKQLKKDLSALRKLKKQHGYNDFDRGAMK